MQKFRVCSFLILGAFILVCFALPGRMTLPPFDRDEARYMQASRQMEKSNDFIEIHFQETARNHQPVGLYWLEVASLKTQEFFSGTDVSLSPWIYRVPALVATAIVGALTTFIGIVLFSPWIGIGATCLLGTSVLFSVESRLATPDPCLLACIMGLASILAVILRQQEKAEKTSYRYSLAYWAIVGFGLLIKGPMILLPALLTPLALSLTGSGKEIWRRLHPLGIWLSLCIAAPWYIAIYFRTNGQFFDFALKHNLLGKVKGGQETHGFPPLYYVSIFLLSFWPGSYLFIKSLPSIWKDRFQWQIRFLLCWILPIWLFFELIPTKLPHYVLPVYPAIALLSAAYFFVLPVSSRKSVRFFKMLYAICWIALSLILFLGIPFLLQKEEIHTNPFFYFFLILTFCSFFLGFFFLFKNSFLKAFLGIIGGALGLELSLYFFVLPVFPLFHLSEKISHVFEKERPCFTSHLISISDKEPSLVFLVGGERVILSGPEQAISLLKDKNACDMLLLDMKREGDALHLAEKEGIPLKEVGQIKGKNYSNGRDLDLRLYKKSS
ncbi:glycosyltransferase family 39 protein [Acetobacteraceae bacterium]|nr:glycosyltransferase family 39 protein [Acetobacteraceae bacterium]